MKAILTSLSLLFLLPFFGFAQQTTVEVLPQSRGGFILGDLTYESNYRGLKRMMSDLEIDNPELHEQLQLDFERISNKQIASNFLGVSGLTVGGIMMIGSISFWQHEERIPSVFPRSSPFYEPPTVVKSPNENLAAAGACIALGGIILAAIVHPRNQDFHDFINTFNRNSNGSKMRWTLGVSSQTGQDLGMGINLQF